jgi:hypothetical protein
MERVENGNLCMYLGYARYAAVWAEHAWCMLDGKIIESEFRREMYFGAELTDREFQTIRGRCALSDLRRRENARMWTINGYQRALVPFDSSIHSATIGYERDPVTNLPKNILGG